MENNQSPKNVRSKNDPKLDGIDHINIAARGGTRLGRFLSHFTRYQFIHEFYGSFLSMEGLWYYVSSEERPDDLRSLYGFKAKKFGKDLKRRKFDGFQDIIIEANYQKIVSNPEMMEIMKETTLPFKHYYLFGDGDVVIEPTNMGWLVEGFEKIRQHIKENKPWVKLDYKALDPHFNDT